ncbi:MAG: hypothetical protein WCT02_01315 [Candidatus Paceibacterota bacterium]
MDIDLTKIEKLLEEKKYEEVRSIIKSVAEKKLTPEENGAVLTGFASAYLELSNAISLRYRDALAEAVLSLQQVNAAEAKALENIKLTEVRAKLNE